MATVLFSLPSLSKRPPRLKWEIPDRGGSAKALRISGRNDAYCAPTVPPVYMHVYNCCMYVIANNAESALSVDALAADRPKISAGCGASFRSTTAVEFDKPPNPGCLKAIGFRNFSRTLFPCRARRPRESYVP